MRWSGLKRSCMCCCKPSMPLSRPCHVQAFSTTMAIATIILTSTFCLFRSRCQAWWAGQASTSWPAGLACACPAWTPLPALQTSGSHSQWRQQTRGRQGPRATAAGAQHRAATGAQQEAEERAEGARTVVVGVLQPQEGLGLQEAAQAARQLCWRPYRWGPWLWHPQCCPAAARSHLMST